MMNWEPTAKLVVEKGVFSSHLCYDEGAIEEELDHWEREGIVEKATHSEYQNLVGESGYAVISMSP